MPSISLFRRDPTASSPAYIIFLLTLYTVFAPIAHPYAWYVLARNLFRGGGNTISGVLKIMTFMRPIASDIPLGGILLAGFLRWIDQGKIYNVLKSIMKRTCKGAAFLTKINLWAENLPGIAKNIPFETQDVRKNHHGREDQQPEMTMDIYPMPPDSNAPIIVFLYGGAFQFASKWYFYLLAQRLRSATGAVIVIPDYPTYPIGTIQEQSETISRCLMFIGQESNANRFGGDHNKIWLVGHSAGAYHAANTIIRSILSKSQHNPHKIGFSNTLPPTLLKQGRCPKIVDLLLGDGPVWQGATSQYPFNNLAKLPNPNNPAVNYSNIPSVSGCVCLGGLFDLQLHVSEMEAPNGLDRMSPVGTATGGYWDAHNVIELVNYACTHYEQYPITPHKKIWPVDGFWFMHSNTDTEVHANQSQKLMDALSCWNESLANRFEKSQIIPIFPLSKSPADTHLSHVELSTTLMGLRCDQNQQPAIDFIKNAMNHSRASI